ncbi:hypothetical protein [Hasllibacter sp. MH4015]|uniref:hypothetical protein n=1 Tax=Hasllibacter sp. MH4015 TaxID=2854029 RepID=UPI001CD547AC|nr:hypothetical protein [Hasllibacter sp. MH4015]
MLARLTLCLALLATTAHADGYAVGDTIEDPMQIAREAFEGFPPDDEGRPGVEVSASTDFFGALTILVAQTGFADDSVAGQREQYVLNRVDNMWEITFRRTDYLCRRGANTVTWQGDLCP